MAGKATVREIAERAGVSRGTVDRVLNQRPHVRPDVKRRVIEAMQALDYVPPREDQAAALGLASSEDKPIRVGMLLPNWKGYFYREIERGIAEAREQLRRNGAEILVEECETDMPEETVERMDQLIEKGAGGLCVCAKDHRLIADKINALSEAGIPVITYNSDINDSKRLCFVGQDIVRGGRVAGDLMSKYLRPGDHVLIGIANPRFLSHRLRAQGFTDKLTERGFDPDCIRTVETYNDYDVTCQVVGEALALDPDIRGAYMANHSVSGCAEAIREAGRRGTIHVISHDLTDATRRLLQRGEIDLAIAQDIYRQGYQPPIMIYEYLRFHTIPEAVVPSIEILCSENIIGRF